MFMQVGFLFLEVGFSRMKNAGTIVPKILANFSIAAICYWAVGSRSPSAAPAGSPGPRAFLGTTDASAFPAMEFSRAAVPAKFFFQFVFCRVAGDRLGHHHRAHQVRRVPDLRGRLQRADLPDHQPLDLRRRLAPGEPGHAGLRQARSSTSPARPARWRRCCSARASASTATTASRTRSPATTCRSWAWRCWCCGSAGSASTPARRSARSAALRRRGGRDAARRRAGVLGAMLVSYLITRKFDMGMTANGAIAALVAITAPSGYVEFWAAPLIGFVAGVIVVGAIVAIDRARRPGGRPVGARHRGHLGHARLRAVHQPAAGGAERDRRRRPVLHRLVPPAGRAGARRRRRPSPRCSRSASRLLRDQEDPACAWAERSATASTSSSTACGAAEAFMPVPDRSTVPRRCRRAGRRGSGTGHTGANGYPAGARAR